VLRRLPLPLVLVAAQAACAALLFGFDRFDGVVASSHGYTPFSAAQTVSPAIWDATNWYAPSARHFLETGRLISGDVAESSGFDSYQSFVPEVLVGGAAWVVGSLDWTWILSQAFLPALTWLLVYLLARRYTPSRVLASVLAWATALVPFGFREAFLQGPTHDAPVELARMYHPALSFLLFLLAALATVWALERGGRLRLALAGIACGGLAYVYYYYWVAMLGGVLLLLVVAWRRRLRLAAIAAVGVAVDAPYLVLTLRADPKGDTRPLFERTGGSFTHHVSATHVAVMVVLVAALAAYAASTRGGARAKPTTLVLLATIAAATVGLNLQLVTGIDPVSDHFVLRFLKPTGFLLAGLLAVRLLTPLARRRGVAVAAILAAAGLVAVGFFRQYDAAARTLEAFRTDTPRMRAMLWLREHTAAGDVVASTDGRFVSELPSVSGNRLFVPGGLRTHVTSDEILTRYLVAARLQGLAWPAVRSALRDRPLRPGEEVWANLSWTLFVSDYAYRARVVERARELWQRLEPRRELATRRLDYLIQARARPSPELRRLFPRARVAYANDGWAVVRLG
jgi:hypothetical protein